MATQLNLMQGTLDMLILKAVSLGPLHGYGVLLRIQQISGDQLAIQQGSLYPALFRLEHQGLIASEWGESDNKRKAKFYRLTVSGRTRLRTEADNWNRMASLIAHNAASGGSFAMCRNMFVAIAAVAAASGPCPRPSTSSTETSCRPTTMRQASPHSVSPRNGTQTTPTRSSRDAGRGVRSDDRGLFPMRTTRAVPVSGCE